MQYWLKKEFAEKFARDSQKETEEERQSTSSLFSSRQILNRSIKKAERLLPLSPQKKWNYDYFRSIVYIRQMHILANSRKSTFPISAD